MKWERDERTDSRRRICVAPESTRMEEGMIEHNRGGWKESSSSDSKAAKEFGKIARLVWGGLW
jgi:hypothetical protein